MARLRSNSRYPVSGNSGGPKSNLIVLGVFFAIGLLFLLPLFPPFGLIWCLAIGKALFKQLKEQGVLKKDVEGKYNVDWNKAKASGQQSFDQVRAYSKKSYEQARTYSQDAAKRYKTRVSESDRMEERQPYRHPHTPNAYSNDACARERRLEQIKALKDAGILDEKEYQKRKADIMAGK